MLSANKFTPEFYKQMCLFFEYVNQFREIYNGNLTPFELFVRDNYNVIDGLTGPEIVEYYNRFCDNNKYSREPYRTIIKELEVFTGKAKNRYTNGSVKKTYKLKDDVYAAYNKRRKVIIDYLKKCRDEDEKEQLPPLNNALEFAVYVDEYMAR